MNQRSVSAYPKRVFEFELFLILLLFVPKLPRSNYYHINIPHKLFSWVLNWDYTITSRGFLNFLSFNMIFADYYYFTSKLPAFDTFEGLVRSLSHSHYKEDRENRICGKNAEP